MAPGGVIGREAELAALAAFLDGLPSGSAAIVLRGEAGVGKTTLWQACIEAAHERSFGVLTASPAAAETGMTFTALADLLAEVLDEVLPALPSPQRRALEVALLLADPEGSGPDQRAVAFAFLTALRALTAARPILVAVDDTQWLDAGSSNVLGYAGRRLHAESVGLLLAERTSDAARPLLQLGRLTAGGRVASIRVGPLTLGALHRLLHERLRLVLPRPILRRVHETAGGNPFYALELARALDRDARAAPGEPLPVPPSLSELVSDRITALPAGTQEALLFAAALSEPRLSVVGAALNRDVRAPLRSAVEAEVIRISGDRIRFAHPLLASAAYGSVDEYARREAHRRLTAVRGELEERARHLALAADGADEGIATTLERAAEHARARGATVAAAELYEQARRLTTPGLSEELHRRTLAAARYRFAVGDMEAARLLLEEGVDAAPAGPLRAEALVDLARVHLYQGDQPHTAELAARALSEAGGDRRARADAGNVLGAALLFMRENLGSAVRHAALSAELAETIGDVALQVNSLSMKGFIEGLMGSSDAAATLKAAAAIGEQRADRVLAGPTFASAMFLVSTDAAGEAAALLRACYDEAIARGDESSMPLVLAYLAVGEYSTGRWREAAGVAEEGYELALQTGQRPQQAFCVSVRGLVRASLGRESEARADAREALALSGERAMAVARVHAVWTLGLLELSLDRPEEAVRLFAPLRHRLIAAGVGEPGSIRFLADEIEALVALGQLDEADTLLGWLEKRGRVLDRASALAAAGRCRGMLLAARRDETAGLAAFERALVEHERVPMPFDRARTLLALGAAQRRAKRKRDARETLAEALATFERLGARIWADRAVVELGQIGGRAPAEGALTPSEQRIAALVAEGRTNREVAAALFLSDRTVESHLTHVYRKLGIRTRAELARRFSA